jgi:hypothetical protein
MLPNISTLDEHGCLWICINPRCPDRHNEEVDAEDLVEVGVPAAWAKRMARLLAFYSTGSNAGVSEIEDARGDLTELRLHLLEIGLLANRCVDIAARLDDSLSVPFLSDDFAEAQAAKQGLAAAGALSATVGRTVADALSSVETIDPELPGFLPANGGV